MIQSTRATRIGAVAVLCLLVAATFGSSLPGRVTSEAFAADATAESVASGVPLTMLLVDTSGSMSEDDGTGRVKIDGAKAALTDFVRGVEGGTPIGLRTYPGGTQTDAGCSVGSLVIPPGPADLTLVDAAIRGLSPDGETPTGPALNAAAADVRDAGYQAATIVLVSDGLSNCGPDPCEIAGQIVASGIDVTVDTVGFQVSQEGQEQLRCIATKTNGSYSDVQNVQELIAELQRLSKPLLSIELRAPASVKAAVGENATGQATVTATVGVDGAQTVRDVQVGFTFTSDRAPAVLGPNRRLGNLNPGETKSVTFTFRPPIEATPRSLEFAVTARGGNSSPVLETGSIRLDQDFSLADAGPLLRNRARAVILGDSYSSGEGASGYDPKTMTTTNGCHRSAGTYAVTLYEVGEVDNFACSGAVSEHLLVENDNNENEPRQIEHLENSDYDIAYMTIGGNDIGFGEIAGVCALPTPGVSCQNYVWGARKYQTAIEERLEGLPSTLFDRLVQVEDALNSSVNVKHRGLAPLVLLAYPSPVPPARTSGGVSGCAPFTADELAFFDRVVHELNESVAAAVRMLREDGRPVYFASSVVDAFQPDHTYCSGGGYVNQLDFLPSLSLEVAKQVTSIPALAIAAPGGAAGKLAALFLADQIDSPEARTRYQEQVHPTALGYQAMTAQLVRWSTSADAKAPVTRDVHRIPVVNADDGGVLKVTTASPTAASLDVQPGAGITIQGSGFAPGATVDVVVRSAPRLLGQAVADDEGRVKVRVALPSSLSIGDHTLEVVGAKGNGLPAVIRAALHVTRARPWWVIPLAVLGVLALIGAIVLWLAARRARVSESRPSPTVGDEVVGTVQGAN